MLAARIVKFDKVEDQIKMVSLGHGLGLFRMR